MTKQEEEMAGHMREMRNACRVVIENSEMKKPFGILGHM
jgi:hypothetical protein